MTNGNVAVRKGSTRVEFITTTRFLTFSFKRSPRHNGREKENTLRLRGNTHVIVVKMATYVDVARKIRLLRFKILGTSKAKNESLIILTNLI